MDCILTRILIARVSIIRYTIVTYVKSVLICILNTVRPLGAAFKYL